MPAAQIMRRLIAWLRFGRLSLGLTITFLSPGIMSDGAGLCILRNDTIWVSLEDVMIGRNFLLGATLAAVLVVPSLAGSKFPEQCGENALAAFAQARAQVETQVASSVKVLSSNLASWLARQVTR
jgi:hypothetical protein